MNRGNPREKIKCRKTRFQANKSEPTAYPLSHRQGSS